MFRFSSGHNPFILDMEDGAPRNNQIIGGGHKKKYFGCAFISREKAYSRPTYTSQNTDLDLFVSCLKVPLFLIDSFHAKRRFVSKFLECIYLD